MLQLIIAVVPILAIAAAVAIVGVPLLKISIVDISCNIDK
jgi:hypothetical protein